jgi:hypothetical protein
MSTTRFKLRTLSRRLAAAIAMAAGAVVFPAYAVPCVGYTADSCVEGLVQQLLTPDRLPGTLLERKCLFVYMENTWAAVRVDDAHLY